MAREINQIIQELESAYAPQKTQIQEQISALPSYYQSQVAGLEQARQNAYQDIVRRANARGVAYSGAPIQEQQVYTGERYLPALAGLRQQEGTQTFNLQQALGKIGETQRLRAEEIRQQELNREEAARQAELNRQAQERAARAAAASYGGFSPTTPTQQPQQQDPISAAIGYAKLKKNEALSRGNVQPGYREAVKNDIINQFGGILDPGTLNDIIYKQVFPDFWEGNRPQAAGRAAPRIGTPQGNRQIYGIGTSVPRGY
jgi:hypothetical protein